MTKAVIQPHATFRVRYSTFVRYNPGTDTTIVGGLTNSDIEVFNENAFQLECLPPGQVAVIHKDRVEADYNFDLRTFYKNSNLIRVNHLSQ